MSKYRKKPVVVDAIQFDGYKTCMNKICDAFNLHDKAKYEHTGNDFHDVLVKFWIVTLEGDMRVDADDWVIRGVKGECYPCKPDIFAATYEPLT